LSDHGHGGGGHAPAAPKASGGGHGGGGGGAIGAASVTFGNGVLVVSGLVLVILGHRFVVAHPDATNIALAVGSFSVFFLLPYWGFRKLWGNPASKWNLSTLALGAWTVYYSWVVILVSLANPLVHKNTAQANQAFQDYFPKSVVVTVIFWIALYVVYGWLVDTTPKPATKKP